MIRKNFQSFQIPVWCQQPAQPLQMFLIICDARHYHMTDNHGNSGTVQCICKLQYGNLFLPGQLSVPLCGAVLHIQQNQIQTGKQPFKFSPSAFPVYNPGRIQTGSYTNKDGQTVYTTEVVAEDQEFAESKAASDANRSSMGGSYQTPSAPNPMGAAGDGFMNIPDGIDEELPFN